MSDQPGFTFVRSELLSKQTSAANILGVNFLGGISLQRVPTSTAENARVRLGRQSVRLLTDADAADALASYLADLAASMTARASAAGEAVTVAHRLLADAESIAAGPVADDDLELIDGHRRRVDDLLVGLDVPDPPEIARVDAAQALSPGEAPLLAYGTVADALQNLAIARGRLSSDLDELRQIPATLDLAQARAVEAHGNELANLAARATAAENRPDLTKQLGALARKAKALAAAIDDLAALAATAAAQEPAP